MPRPKKEKPNRSDQRFEVKRTVGHTFDGKPIRKSFYSTISKADAKRQAEEYLIESKAATLAGIPMQQGSANFSDWAEHWLSAYKERTVRPSTFVNTYQNTVRVDLIPYFGSAQLSSITPADVQTFFNRRAGGSFSKLSKLKLCLYGIFETAVDNGLCARNPARNVQLPARQKASEKRAYAEQEASALLQYAAGKPDGLGVLLLLAFGLRRGELLGLLWEDFDFETRTLRISRAVSLVNGRPMLGEPKNKTSIRVLPIPPDVLPHLAERRGSGLVFQNQKGGVYDPHNWKVRLYDPFLEKASADLSIEPLNPHELRHTCGTLLYARTKNIYAVSKFLGHANINITAKIYVHNDVDTLRESLGF